MLVLTTSGHGRFFKSHNFNADISAWDTSSVTEMLAMSVQRPSVLIHS